MRHNQTIYIGKHNTKASSILYACSVIIIGTHFLWIVSIDAFCLLLSCVSQKFLSLYTYRRLVLGIKAFPQVNYGQFLNKKKSDSGQVPFLSRALRGLD